jgi:hypothetical protein
MPVLDPRSKLEYFRKNWGPELLEEVTNTMKTLVCMPHSAIFHFYSLTISVY